MKKITPKSIRMFLAAAIPAIAVILCICILTVRRQEKRPVQLKNNDPAVSKQQTDVQNESSALSFLPASSVQENVSSDVAINRPAPAELKPLAAVHYPQQDSSYSPRQQSSNKTEPVDRAFQNGYSRFAAKSASLLLKETKSGQNACYSPISLFMAASMLTECTAGKSQKELLAMLGMNSTAQIRKEIPAFFRNNYFSNDCGSLALANSVWVQKNANLKPDLFHRLAKDYYAETFAVSFGQKDTANRIGSWLKEHTGGKFSQAPKAADNPLTALMLINAIYFKNEWQDPFYDDRNEPGSFTPADGKTVNTVFMRRDSKMQAAVKNGYTLVDLPMKNNCKMRLILPEKSPAALYDQADTLSSVWDSSTSEYLVHLKLPKFGYYADMNLIQSMRTMGVSKVFSSGTADFSPLTERDDIYLSEAIQKTYISVNEKGCEAAAYTSFALAEKGMPLSEKQPPELTVTLDRPFLFSVSRGDTVLFVGEVNNPVSK